jgi:hypothetical protein
LSLAAADTATGDNRQEWQMSVDDRIDAQPIDVFRAVLGPLCDRIDALHGAVAHLAGSIRALHDTAPAVPEAVWQLAQQVSGLDEGVRQLREHVDAVPARVPAGVGPAAGYNGNAEWAAQFALLDEHLDRIHGAVLRATEDGAARGTLAAQVADDVDALAATLRRLEGAAGRDAGTTIAAEFEQVRTEAQRAAHDASAARAGLGASVERLIGRLDAGANRVVQAVESLPAHAAPPDDTLAPLLEELHRELRLTRHELSTFGRSNDGGGAAGAALAASTATAMARLDARIDSEFDALHRKMEALATLMCTRRSERWVLRGPG